jgi:hypothetical protein
MEKLLEKRVKLPGLQAAEIGGNHVYFPLLVMHHAGRSDHAGDSEQRKCREAGGRPAYDMNHSPRSDSIGSTPEERRAGM